MLFIDNQGVTDARVNLALEEHVLREKLAGDDCVLFYINAPAIIIGRNQNTIEEIDPDVVAARGITVVRRISGGGAVYHDLGNLNFSFMTPAVSDRFNRYEHFTRPVVAALRALGVPAELSGRNDILAEGRKISGNAQFATPDRMFSHGTLLFDANLDDVTAALRPKPGKVESKGIKSIRSRVANIREFASEPVTVEELRERILEAIFGTRDRARIPTLALTAADWGRSRRSSSGSTGRGRGTMARTRRRTCNTRDAFRPARSTRASTCRQATSRRCGCSATSWDGVTSASSRRGCMVCATSARRSRRRSKVWTSRHTSATSAPMTW